jgi:hypothetical protein
MKNIHILPTSQPSRLKLNNNIFDYSPAMMFIQEKEWKNQNIYITSEEEIKEGDWYISFLENEVYKATKETQNIMSVANLVGSTSYKKTHFKIILTTDQDLIKDGVQAIDDEFLEWFVKNPSCKEVEVDKEPFDITEKGEWLYEYKIIIPKEEPKTAWVGVLHDKLNEYYPAEYELKDIYQGEGCLPNFPNEELCQIWCDSKYKEEPNYNMKQEILDEMEKQETLKEYIERETKGIIEPSLRAAAMSFLRYGAKWQQEQDKNKFSGEDMKQFGDWCRNGLLNTEYGLEKLDEHLEQWKQLKKK